MTASDAVLAKLIEVVERPQPMAAAAR